MDTVNATLLFGSVWPVLQNYIVGGGTPFIIWIRDGLTDQYEAGETIFPNTLSGRI